MTDTRDMTCDICNGPLGQQRWRGFPPICGRCEMDSIHGTPDLSGPYLDAYNRLRDLRNQLADTFRTLEEGGEAMAEGEPIVEMIEQIQDLTDTFVDALVKPMDWDVDEVVVVAAE